MAVREPEKDSIKVQSNDMVEVVLMSVISIPMALLAAM